MSETEMGDTQENKPPKIDNPELSETQANTPQEPQINQESNNKVPRRGRAKLLLSVLLGLIVFLSLGALGGMQSGIQARQNQEQLDRAVEAVAQFQLGEADLANNQCEIARQRFEYVIQLNSSYPGAAEKLAASMLCVGVDNSPTEIATLAPTATLDGRAASEIYPQALGYFDSQNWDALLPLLDSIRNSDPNYEALEVDRMYYLALRNRGAARILSLGELESGIFDINQAEQIGPLDIDAANYRDWAIIYIVGQSFWEVDWGQAVQYFSQIASVAPNLSDANFYTAENRLLDAQVQYAQELIADALFLAGARSWCDAKDLLSDANSNSPHSPEIQETAVWIADKCENANN